jgi:hypothetical protein
MNLQELLILPTGQEELLFILRLRNYILSYLNFSAEFRIKYALKCYTIVQG